MTEYLKSGTGWVSVDDVGNSMPTVPRGTGGAALLPNAAALADAAANPTTVTVGADLQVWNSGTWDRVKSAAAATLATASGVGVVLSTIPGNWTVPHAPAAAVVATATKAAGAAGVRHICTGISATLACGANAQTPINVYLRDGAAGAGTIIWAGSASAPVSGSCVIAVTDIAIVGSAATAMTLEFSAAGVAASVQAVTLIGYDAT